MRRLILLFLFSLLLACPTPGGDDDDTVDDDDVGDDDDSTPNTAPTANDDEATTEVGTAVWIDVLDNDTDPQGDDLEIEVLSPAADGTVVRDAGGVLYTPDAGFAGTDTFDYLIADPGGLTDGATVTVEVNCAGGFEVMSLTSVGALADDDSRSVAVSGDGAVVVFESDAALVPEDTNTVTDIYLADRVAGTIELVSTAWDGGSADDASSAPGVSADGAWVAYESYATNLVQNDTNATRDIFLWERGTGTTVRASRKSNGDESDGGSSEVSLSADGRYVAFSSYGNLDPVVTFATSDVWVFDRVTEAVELISVSTTGVDGIQTSGRPSISGDGSLVAFRSMAWDLVTDDTDGVNDIFLRDRGAETTARINLPTGVLAADGHSQRPAISQDGSTVAFTSQATNLVAGDTEGVDDVFVVTVASGVVERVSVDSLEVASTAESDFPDISADGRFVAFTSEGALDATGTAGVRDLYVRDRTAGTTTHASVGCAGQANASDIYVPVGLASDGTGLVFASNEADLMTPLVDDNASMDVFWVPNPAAP